MQTTRAELLSFIRSHHLAVQASVAPSGAPQAAVVGIVVTDDFTLFFDSLDVTRKVQNLRRAPRIAFVIGGPADGEESTVQYEGIVDEPSGAELADLQAFYFQRFPDGLERQKLPTVVYLRVRPAWIRYSDYGRVPPLIEEFVFPDPQFASPVPFTL